MTVIVLLLLLVSYIIICRNNLRIKRYENEAAKLISRLKQFNLQNEELIASRKKAVHTITHELRTPLTAITGYAGLMSKEHDADKTELYVQNIQQSSERMRGMLDTLLDFFGWITERNIPTFPHAGFPLSRIPLKQSLYPLP